MTTQGLSNKISSLNIQQVAVAALEETKEIHSDLNVEQMNKGLRADGSPISPSYSNFTIELKKLKGQPFDKVTLRDSGAFQSAIFTRVEGLKVITGSTDPNSAKLEKKYSLKRGSIFGLGPVAKAEYLKDLRPASLDKVRRALK